MSLSSFKEKSNLSIGEKKRDIFQVFITSQSTRQAGYFVVIAFCEGMKRKRKLLRKERKLSAVMLIFAGENEARTRRT